MQDRARGAAERKLTPARVPVAAHHDQVRTEIGGAREQHFSDGYPAHTFDLLGDDVRSVASDDLGDVGAGNAGRGRFAFQRIHSQDGSLFRADKERQRVMQRACGLAAPVPREEYASADGWEIARVGHNEHWPSGGQHEVLRELLSDERLRIVRIKLPDDGQVRKARGFRHDFVRVLDRTAPLAVNFGVRDPVVEALLELRLPFFAECFLVDEVVGGSCPDVKGRHLGPEDDEQTGEVRLKACRELQRKLQSRKCPFARIEVNENVSVTHRKAPKRRMKRTSGAHFDFKQCARRRLDGSQSNVDYCCAFPGEAEKDGVFDDGCLLRAVLTEVNCRSTGALKVTLTEYDFQRLDACVCSTPRAANVLTKEKTMSDKRIAFVTGGMGGLGAAICRHLLSMDMTVTMSHSTRNDHVSTWLMHERDAGRRFHAYEMDVADFDSCAQCAKRVIADHGAVDILINNAGITRDATFAKMTKADWDAVMRTDLDAIFNVTKAFISPMVERGFGRIINIGSVNGSRGAFGQTNYAAAKAGIHGFTKALALEVAKRGVTVNTVSPGYLDTAMLASIPDNVMKERILPQIPVGRLGRPEEVAALVAFLCSDDAGFVTGADLAINGGMHMH